ncbi:hypothetical protein SAMN04487848_3146 [Microbacterium sp. ru370.1]|uniref:hypothetical protein n=1 Tax=Microbacterium sp. ru370.1 TaxID=1761809 RepID=UPI00087F94A6|nr:hypothetical protein [Microbacterium sp. ru370.1]SDP06689.1 hypothetical protein SAMN04487848_3146 [Microbacterium sp. ru370.1]SIT93774.1 hypothetical protein SAMN05880579_3204 [Microbacterium sp. RU1D]
MVTVLLIDAALVALLLLVVGRARAARRQPRARIAWLAGVVGAVALLTQGTVIPLGVLDALLGGSNILKLVQGVLTMVALWLGIQAGIAPVTARVSTLRWRVPAILAVVFAVVFFVAMPVRPGTSFRFIEDAVATSTGAWVYGVVHMAGIALVGTMLCVSARVSLPGVRWFFRAGAIGIVLGCVSEIVDLTLTRFFTPVPVVSALFDPLFYLGVLAFVVGIFRASRVTGRIRRRAAALLEEIDAVAERRGVASLPGLADDPSVDTRLHALRVAVEDHAIASSSPLDATERALLDDIDAHLTRRSTGVRS